MLLSSRAVKAFDHRTNALPGFNECCLGGKQGWGRSCCPLILGQIFCNWRAKGLLSMGSFPEHPSSAGMQSCLCLLTKRCHELFKGFVWKSWECDLRRRVSWTLSDIWGAEGEKVEGDETTALCTFGTNMSWRKGGLSKRKIADQLISGLCWTLQQKLIERIMQDVKVVNG